MPREERAKPEKIDIELPPLARRPGRWKRFKLRLGIGREKFAREQLYELSDNPHLFEQLHRQVLERAAQRQGLESAGHGRMTAEVISGREKSFGRMSDILRKNPETADLAWLFTQLGYTVERDVRSEGVQSSRFQSVLRQELNNPNSAHGRNLVRLFAKGMRSDGSRTSIEVDAAASALLQLYKNRNLLRQRMEDLDAIHRTA
ncbi:MAG: hypothetical protein V1787_03435 [Candidatus Micrarchaeota archaeon]